MTAEGFNNNRTLLQRLAGDQTEGIGMLLHKLGEDIVAEARHLLQQQQAIDSGHLLSSVRILDESFANYIVVGSDVFYAGIVEFGRGPIKASPGKVLHFFTKDGQEVFTKSVGPAEPQPYLGPAVELHSKVFQDVYAEINENVIRRASSGLLDAELL
jgi:hypothetical protein